MGGLPGDYSRQCLTRCARGQYRANARGGHTPARSGTLEDHQDAITYEARTMKRRTFLGAWSAIGLGIGSGCTGSGPETVPSSPENSTDGESTQEMIEEIKAEEAALELRETNVDQELVEYGDEFTVSATLANVGRDPIRANNLNSAPEFAATYAESGQLFDNRSQSDAGDIELDSGETTTIRLGPFDAAVAGAWTVEAGRHIEFVRDGAETTFEIAPRRLSVGHSVPLLRGVSMTVDRFHLLESFFAEYVPQQSDRSIAVGLETAPEGQLFVVTELTIANEGQDFIDAGPVAQAHRLSTSQFTVSPADSHRSSEQIDRSRRGFRLPGEPLEAISLDRGETATAWLLGTVDIAQRDELTVEFDKWQNTGPPEARVNISEPAYPEFKLVEFISPDRWEDRPQRFGAIVENVGTAPGTFQGIVQYQGFDTEAFVDPSPGNELEAEIEPGETVEVTTEYDLESGVRYRVQPFDETIRL